MVDLRDHPYKYVEYGNKRPNYEADSIKVAPEDHLLVLLPASLGGADSDNRPSSYLQAHPLQEVYMCQKKLGVEEVPLSLHHFNAHFQEHPHPPAVENQILIQFKDIYGCRLMRCERKLRRCIRNFESQFNTSGSVLISLIDVIPLAKRDFI